jgi:hypothetical protein
MVDNAAKMTPKTTNNDDESTNSQGVALVDKFVIRLPDGLRNEVKKISEANHRSMNSEIVMVLEKHVQKNQVKENEGTKNDNMQAEEEEVTKRLDDLKEALLQLMS